MKFVLEDNIDILKFEKEYQNNGYKMICGTDEVGRGPLVGPVCAAAVIMDLSDIIEGVNDSKKLSDKKRRELAKIIKERALAYSISFVDSKTIDKINILEASRLAMSNAIRELKIRPDIILSDCMKLDIDGIENNSLVKGDMRSYSIACASIIAKVDRDDYMINLDSLHPEYHFKENKGYPTKFHLEAIKVYGLLDEHRKSFKPVKELL